ncbi:MAG: hypothetical protein AAF604_22770 [Acidobacteriota bacterium]
MITGYNTDVRHGEVVLHVQTEDKGHDNPCIESLVYFGGQVLAARRAPYDELLEDGKGEKEIIALMDRQHRTMIAAIRSGRLDEKLGSLRGERPGTGPVETTEADEPEPAEVEDDGVERTLDQVILDYLTSEADQEQLLLVLDEEPGLTLGQPGQVDLRTTSSKSGQAVVGAEVIVKMISTVDEPRTLASGTTDEAGGLRLAFEIPALGRGTAALIITASSDIGRAELKQLL